MRLGEAKTYKEYYCVIEVENGIKSIIRTYDNFNKSNKTKLGYIDENMILVFEKKKDAISWIEKNSYNGMSFKYCIEKLINCKDTNYRWTIK